jgi:hypothetical protein
MNSEHSTLECNRVYWEYDKGSWWRPTDFTWSKQMSDGVRVTVPEYSRRSSSFKKDLSRLVFNFHRQHKGDYVITMSGGVDSEVTAQAFYDLGVPFRVLILSLFDGINKGDIIWAVKWCKDHDVDYKIVKLSLNQFMNETIQQAIECGQFVRSPSQMALTELFNHISPEEIIIFSGHNPDFHPTIGIGWQEDSPNMVKYAINVRKRFFTFTSLEPIFCWYAAHYDSKKAGNKDSRFIHEAYPTIKRRPKLTGWEFSHPYLSKIYEKIDSLNSHIAYEPFITWDKFK